jgi:hypothetical protein
MTVPLIIVVIIHVAMEQNFVMMYALLDVCLGLFLALLLLVYLHLSVAV